MNDSARIEDLRRRVQQDPASIAFAQLAEELRRAGAFQEAVDVARAGLTRHPNYLSAHVTLGRALLQLNHLEEARAEFERVLQAAPQNLAALRGMADAHRKSGDTRQALSCFQQALALAPNDPELERAVAALRTEAAPDAPSAESVASAVPAPDARGGRVIAALERFLHAVHVPRA